MAKGQRHIDNNGNIGVCRASDASRCPYDSNGGHHDTREEAEAAYGALQENGGIPESFKRVRNPKSDGFSLEDGGFYGDVPPRTIQIDALNDTAQALIEDGNTQLVAACGTGKSYMGRQLMRRMMEEDDANGVAIVLTSSVKLARDTAADLMPDSEGNYDRAMGEHDEDYNVQVIEVHNEAKGVKTKGAISPEKIAEQWQEALDEGKRVVVVSTYQSAELVQKVQALIGERAEADLLMNDEAHNILGQKKSVSSSADAENSGYRSFANEIPGAIQAKHRLYATATPSLADSPDDDETAAKGATREEQIASLQAQAAKMSANGKERLTVYSDDELIVGRVSGAITQQSAIGHGYLTEPDYQLRAAKVNVDSADSFVDHRGRAVAASGDSEPMTAQTYSAVSATLQAMTEDPKTDEAGRVRNPVHNALAYTGSISQANAFKANFRAVALEQSGNMSISDAEANKDSSDPELRRRARLRLLAESAVAEAAHSGNTVAEKEKAFSMFRGRSYSSEEDGGWSPHKRVLANVDIFSEGVSINEIDTVVIADQAKTSERAMTQAIGRSLRTIGGNTEKNTGHVIIPQVVSENGKELNGGLVTAASYGATRVERAVSTRKLKGEAVAADETTRVTRYSEAGAVQGRELAASIAQAHVKSPEDFVASQAIERAHSSLGSVDRKKATAEKVAEVERYRNASRSEQAEMQRTFIRNQAESPKVSDSSWAVANKMLTKVDNSDMGTLRQSGRVVTSALSAGDFSAVPAPLADKLTRAGVIRKRGGGSDGPTVEEKRSLALSSSRAVAAAFISPGGQAAHPDVAAFLSKDVDTKAASMYANTQGKRGSEEEFGKLVANYETMLKHDGAVEKIYGSLDSSVGDTKAASGSLSGLLQQRGGMPKESVWSSLAELKSRAADRSARAAASGSAEYELDPAMVMKNGRLKAPAQKGLSELI